jgi:hypothetical protein
MMFPHGAFAVSKHGYNLYTAYIRRILSQRSLSLFSHIPYGTNFIDGDKYKASGKSGDNYSPNIGFMEETRVRVVLAP